MNEQVSSVTIFLAVVAPLIGFLGVLVGQWGTRGREIRELRRRAYVDWLIAVQRLPLFEMPSGGGTLYLPTLEMTARMNDLQAEVAVVASRRVLESTREVMDIVAGSEYAQAMANLKIVSGKEVFKTHVEFTGDAWRQAVERMRKDMLPWWRWKSRELPFRPDAI